MEVICFCKIGAKNELDRERVSRADLVYFGLYHLAEVTGDEDQFIDADVGKSVELMIEQSFAADLEQALWFIEC